MSGSPPSTSVAEALDRLVEAARQAGLDLGQARAEGESLSAAVAESAEQAHRDWAEQTGHRTTQDFFDAAHRGRRWRGAPTMLLSRLLAEGSSRAAAYADALAEVSLAAQNLGRPDPRIAGNAALAAAAQRNAARPGSNPATVPAVPSLDLAADHPLTPGAFPGFGTPLLADPVVPQPPPTGPSVPDTGAPAPVGSEPQAGAEAETGEAQADEPPPKTLEELLAELDALIGLAEVKAEIHRQVAVLRVEALRAKAGLRSPTITRHLVFVGNPGTGKTTVARLVGGIYRALGLLSKGQLVEVDRSELVAGYLGQTAMKTAEVVASAAGGVLFIDEAYSLAGDQYGREAVDTLVKEMEDRRDDLVLIVAGYPDPMALFIAQNPGLASRFRTTIEFADYTDDELAGIFTTLAAAADYDVSDDVARRFRTILSATPRGPIFGNGRFARNQLEAAIGRHAWRLRDIAEPTLEQLRELQPDDLDEQPDDLDEQPAEAPIEPASAPATEESA